MPFHRIFFIFLFLSLFAGEGLAQTDSVYSRMTLGSAGYKSEYGFIDKYARSQATLLKKLKSTELALTAVRYCFGEQQTPPTEAVFKSYAAKCAAALKIIKVTDDTVSLAFGDPKISGLVPAVYLNNLMEALQADNMQFAFEKNQKSLDSLDDLMDKAYMQLAYVQDTLYSFSKTTEFHTQAQLVLGQMIDTVASMKRKLIAIGCDSSRVKGMFRQMDTLLAQFKVMYTDTVSEFWPGHLNDISIDVFECEQLLPKFQITVNATVTIVTDTSFAAWYRDRQKETMINMLEEQLDQNLMGILHHSFHYSMEAPKGKTFKAVLKRYQKRRATYVLHTNARANYLLQRSTITPGARIVCRASKIKC